MGGLDAAVAAGIRRSAHPSSGLSSPAGAHPSLPGPCRLQTRGRQRICPWRFSGFVRGSGGKPGSRWRGAVREGGELRPGRALSRYAEAECTCPGPRGARPPPAWCAGSRARDCGPGELQPANSPRSPEVLSAAAGEKVRECGRGLRTAHVDYLVRISRAQKTHDLVCVRGLIHSTERPGRSPEVSCTAVRGRGLTAALRVAFRRPPGSGLKFSFL